jgi:two-component system, sensor histidine kinase and response regulator
MSTSQTSMLAQTVSAVVFEQLRALLEQTAQTAETKALILTDAILAEANPTVARPERFTVVVSSLFSALLTGVGLPDGAVAPTAYQISLRFEPEAIATFLASLNQVVLPASVRSALIQAQSILQPNNSAVQSSFTIRLIATLTDQLQVIPAQAIPTVKQVPAEQRVAESMLCQQLERESLFNQVTMQIRQSLDLQVILQTTVEQACQFLQVSRLVIYQFNSPIDFSIALSDSNGGSQFSAPSAYRSGGVVTYEARASEAISSVLHLIESCNLLQEPQRLALYQQDFTLAVEDIEKTYTTLSCLLKFLRTAKVRAKLVTPIEVQGRLWGLLIAHHCDRPYQWQESEQRFLRQIAGHLAIAITQAQLYAQVQQQNQTLEQRVMEHTQNLQDALLAAQAAHRAKSEFLSAMSHELRTPLTTVIGMSATLLRWSFGELSQRQRHYLQTIHNSGEHLLQLINDILDLSQLEAGKAVLNLSEISLIQLARQSLRSLQEKATLGSVVLKLDLRVEAEWDRFKADPRRVQQILVNLLSNAVKFTPENGKVTLRVFADQTAAVLQVKDTGIGIPEEQQSLLFHKFQQLDASYHRQYEGAGVGLALTKQLVELHGGSIAVESRVGIGSVFTVRLPRAQRSP